VSIRKVFIVTYLQIITHVRTTISFRLKNLKCGKNYAWLAYIQPLIAFISHFSIVNYKIILM